MTNATARPVFARGRGGWYVRWYDGCEVLVAVWGPYRRRGDAERAARTPGQWIDGGPTR